MNLEKAYWALKGSNSKFDLETLQKIISPPLPAQLSERRLESAGFSVHSLLVHDAQACLMCLMSMMMVTLTWLKW